MSVPFYKNENPWRKKTFNLFNDKLELCNKNVYKIFIYFFLLYNKLQGLIWILDIHILVFKIKTL